MTDLFGKSAPIRTSSQFSNSTCITLVVLLPCLLSLCEVTILAPDCLRERDWSKERKEGQTSRITSTKELGKPNANN